MAGAKSNPDAPFCNITTASEKTGLSVFYIRQNMDKIPHIKSGKKYMIHVDGLMNFVANEIKKNTKE